MLSPGVALALLAAGYFWLGASVYRKRWGRLPFSTRVILAPARFGQWLSLPYYRRHCRAWDEVLPGLLIGSCLNNQEAARARAEGVTAVLDLTSEFAETSAFLTLAYSNLPILDLTAPTVEQLQAAVAFIHDEIQRGKVYVHCKVGYSRSAAAAGAYLLSSGNAANVNDALAILRRARPTIIVRPEAKQAVTDYAASLTNSTDY